MSGSRETPRAARAAGATGHGAGREGGPEGTVELLERDETVARDPGECRVVILNDDYTPMDFVVDVLETIFGKGPAEAYGLMMRVHREGRAVAGIFARAAAEAKVAEVHHAARAAGHPLRAVVEGEGD